MNETKKKWYSIAIIVISVICIVFIGITSVNGRSKSKPVSKYGEEANRINNELRSENAELRSNLDSVTDNLREANNLVGELRTREGRAIAIALRTNDRLTEFENAMDGTTDLIERIERRQYRIDTLVTGLRTDNRELREALGIGNTGR